MLLVVNDILYFLGISIQEKASMCGHVFGNKSTFIGKSQNGLNSVIASHDDKAFGTNIKDIETRPRAVFSTQRGRNISDCGGR